MAIRLRDGMILALVLGMILFYVILAFMIWVTYSPLVESLTSHSRSQEEYLDNHLNSIGD